MGREFERSMKDRAARDELLSAYLDDQLDAGDRARLEAQLAIDPALRAELEALRHTVALVREMPSQPIPRNFILPQTVVSSPRTAPAVRPRRRWLAPFLTAATAVVSLLFVAVLAGDLFFSGVSGMTQLAAPVSEERAAMVPSPAEGTAGEEEAEKALSITESPAEEAPPGFGAEGTQVPNAEAPEAPSLQSTPLPETPGETQEAGDGEGRYAGATPEAEGSPGPAEVGGGGEPPAESPVPTSIPTTGEAADSAASTDMPEPKESVSVPLPATVESTERAVRDKGPAPDDGTEAGPPPAEGGDEGWHRSPSPAWETPWRAIEVALGVAALLLALAMVWAWRARRR
ncbi:MAG: zf-HC2 domain-containing protein [Anaerolineae bacterium]|jgi:hypothetical protein